MAGRQNLLIMPPTRLDAFTATAVLADLLCAEPDTLIEIICRQELVPFFQDAPGRLRFVTYSDDFGPGLSVMMHTMGRRWHRVVSLTGQRLPFLLWAGHRHLFQYQPESYAMPSLLAPEGVTAPHIWIPKKLHLPLPETLAPNTPLVVFAIDENNRAAWGWRDYAELAWRLADSVPQLAGAHIIVLSSSECGLAEDIITNIPAGQISRLTDLPYAKQGALLARAQLLIGTDRLAARMAPYAGTNLVLRLDREDNQIPGRPYGLYIGQDVAQVAAYVGNNLVKPDTKSTTKLTTESTTELTTESVASAMSDTMSENMSDTNMEALAAQIDRINDEH